MLSLFFCLDRSPLVVSDTHRHPWHFDPACSVCIKSIWHNLFHQSLTIGYRANVNMYLKAAIWPQRHKLCWQEYESKCKFVLHVKELWSHRLWCYVYKSGPGNDSGTKRHKQTPCSTVKCHYISELRLCVHLMESEKQYYM